MQEIHRGWAEMPIFFKRLFDRRFRLEKEVDWDIVDDISTHINKLVYHIDNSDDFIRLSKCMLDYLEENPLFAWILYLDRNSYKDSRFMYKFMINKDHYLVDIKDLPDSVSIMIALLMFYEHTILCEPLSDDIYVILDGLERLASSYRCILSEFPNVIDDINIVNDMVDVASDCIYDVVVTNRIEEYTAGRLDDYNLDPSLAEYDIERESLHVEYEDYIRMHIMDIIELVWSGRNFIRDDLEVICNDNKLLRERLEDITLTEVYMFIYSTLISTLATYLIDENTHKREEDISVYSRYFSFIIEKL